MKNRNILIAAVIVVVILVAVGILFAMRSTTKKPVINSTMTPTQSAVESAFPTAGVYTNKTYGFSIKYDSNLEATTTFTPTYLNATKWNVFADPKRKTGQPLAAFVRKGSSDALRAELRVGYSTDAVDVSTCLDTHDNAETRQITINGTKFTQFTTADEGTKNFNQISSYRTVHGTACIALDMIITGTNTANPANNADTETSVANTTPFEQSAAWQDLAAALNSFTFAAAK